MFKLTKLLTVAAMSIAMLTPAKAELSKQAVSVGVVVRYLDRCSSKDLSQETIAQAKRLWSAVPSADQAAFNASWDRSMAKATRKDECEFLKSSILADAQAAVPVPLNDRWCAEQTKNMSPYELQTFARDHRPVCDHWYWLPQGGHYNEIHDASGKIILRWE
jgi:hypothetical protein